MVRGWESEQPLLFDPGPPDAVVRSDLVHAPLTNQLNGLGQLAFDRANAPSLFGWRDGVGPLVIFPDSNVLIDIYSSLDVMEYGVGQIEGPQAGPEWLNRQDALVDLLAVWCARDIRFWTGPPHLADGKRPLEAARAEARRVAVEIFARDAWMRGGLHPATGRTDFPGLEWPTGALDRALVEAALASGCDVFLTGDHGVLKRDRSFRRWGLRILKPEQLMEEFWRADELGPPREALDPYPDLAVLSTFYSLRSPQDA